MATRVYGPKRPKRYVETEEFGAMVRRMVAAYRRRVGEGPGDIASLRRLAELSSGVDAAIRSAAQDLHDAGHSWTEIGDALGITRQAARQRVSRPGE